MKCVSGVADIAVPNSTTDRFQEVYTPFDTHAFQSLLFIITFHLVIDGPALIWHMRDHVISRT